MNIKNLHAELENFNVQTPVVSMPTNNWMTLLLRFAQEYFTDFEAKGLETPLEGIVADIRAKNQSLQCDYLDPSSIRISNYAVEFELTSKEKLPNPKLPGHISQHNVLFKEIVFEVQSKSGSIVLVRKSESYFVQPPISGSNRDAHFKYLKDNYGYKDEQIDYFKNMQEPAAGLLLANGLLERFDTPFEIITFNKIFPKLGFEGDFDIRDIIVDGTEFICFIPDKINKKQPTPCETEDQYNRTSSSGSAENGVLSVRGYTYRGTTNGTKPIIDHSILTDLYVYFPESINEQLFSVPSVNGSKVTLAKSSGSYEFPPFQLKESSEVYTTGKFDFEWEEQTPVVNVKASLALDFGISVWLKIFKLKKLICRADTQTTYTIEYKGSLIDLYKGDVAFVGELYDPTNVSLDRLYFESLLPDTIDKLLGKILKYVLEPLMRVVVTAVIIYVTWPFISNYLYTAIQGKIIDGAAQKLPKVKVSDYFSNKKSAIFGINTSLEIID